MPRGSNHRGASPATHGGTRPGRPRTVNATPSSRSGHDDAPALGKRGHGARGGRAPRTQIRPAVCLGPSPARRPARARGSRRPVEHGRGTRRLSPQLGAAADVEQGATRRSGRKGGSSPEPRERVAEQGSGIASGVESEGAPRGHPPNGLRGAHAPQASTEVRGTFLRRIHGGNSNVLPPSLRGKVERKRHDDARRSLGSPAGVGSSVGP
jgi:hypothetical protein